MTAIFVTVTTEPPEYYGAGPNDSCISLHLAFDANDKPTIQALLDTLGWTFVLHRWDAATGTASQVPTTDIDIVQQWLETRDVNGESIATWLDERRVFASPTPFPIGETIEAEKANAAGILLGGVAWSAPVPHAAHLMRVLKLANVGAVDVSNLFLLPIVFNNGVDTIAVTPASPAQPGQHFALVVNSPGPYNGYTINTNEILWTLADAGVDLPTTVDEALDVNAFPVPVRSDGFLFSVRAEEDFRFIQAFESRAASLFSILPALLDLDGVEGKPLETISKVNLWRLGIAAALDPLWTSLLSPGAGLREGALLAPLMRICDRRNATAQERITFQTWLRNELKQITLARLLDDIPAVPATATPEIPAILKGLFSLPGTDEDFSVTLQSLREISAKLQQESGLEQVLDRVMNHLSEIASSAGHQNYVEWMAEYRQLISSPWNAVDAIRNDYGHLLSVWLANESRLTNPPAELYDVTVAADAYTQRLTTPAATTPWFNWFGSSVLAVAPLITDPQLALEKAWKAAVRRTFADVVPTSMTRFVPDRAPEPLPIAIAATPSAEDLDKFTAVFNGIAVLLQREAQAWAHGNLASVHPLEVVAGSLRYRPSWAAGQFALSPFLPVSMDNRREMFVPYRGLPLASPAYGATSGPGNEAIELDPLMDPLRRPFYIQDDVDFSLGPFQKPPRLGYGFSYSAIAFAVSKAGAPPLALQDTAAAVPWKLASAVNLAGVPQPLEITANFDCQRRTAIGATTFGDSPGQPQRIGAQYADVHPLTQDYPRASLSAGHDGETTLDLFRRTDGLGQLPAPETNTNRYFSLSGHQLATSDSNAALVVTIEVHSDANVVMGTTSLAEVELDRNALTSLLNQNWAVEIIAQGGTATTPPANPFRLQLTAPLDPEAFVWVRLRLTTAADSATWSFSAPEPNTAENPGAQHGSQPPVLLVADDVRRWSGQFVEAAEFECVLSRTTWLDWERWFNNPTLPINGDPTSGLFSDTAKALVEASLMRGEDPSGELSKLLDRLPDPAVGKFLVELTQVDKVVSSDPDLTADSVVLNTRDWVFTADIPQLGHPPDYQQYFDDLRELLRNVDRRFRLNVNAKGGTWNFATSLVTVDGNTFHSIDISVPPGAVAKLTVRPLVDMRLFDVNDNDSTKPLYSGLLQLSSGTRNDGGVDYAIFPGAELTIEGMLDTAWGEPPYPHQSDYKNILDNYLEVQCVTESRGYRIVEVEPAQTTELARCFSHIDVRTQRWRFSGRPIYSWISPRSFRRNQAAGGEREAAMELVDDAQNNLTNFESQIFFERDDLDCQVARVRLLGPGTEIASIQWESPSATYYRHAFALISRYAGALLNAERDGVWPRRVPEWRRRCAILADGSRLDVTSPQARCLVPLSTDAEVFDNNSTPTVVEPQYPKLTEPAPSPPLLCVLEEKPFAVGGLADRILPELLTGVGYGFESGVVAVQPLDTGKETSRDGRLDSRSWKYDAADQVDPSHFFVLEAEGPIGTHFERATVPAPAWVNCQYMLKPRTIDHSFLPDESFFGIRLQRILEPDWVVRAAPVIVAPATLPLAESWQASTKDWAIPAPSVIDLVVLQLSTGPVPVLQCDVEPGRLVFRFNRQLLGKGYTPGTVVVCAIRVGATLPELRLQHLCRGEDRYALSILANAGDASLEDSIEHGTINSPVLLARVDWKATDTLPVTTGVEKITFSSPFEVEKITGSPTTIREWGRTAKNADWLHRFDGRECKRIPIAAVTAARTVSNSVDKLSFSTAQDPALWLMSSQADSRQPLYIQRHLAVIFTKRSTGDGKRFDLYHGACMLNGRSPTIKDARGATKLQIHELEIPSAIVAARAGLTEFASARLDLISTGGSNSVRSCRLHVRFANSASGLSNSSAISIQVNVTDENGNPVSLGVVPCDNNVRAVDIFLQDNLPIKYRHHTTRGAVNPVATLTGSVANVLGAISIDVSLSVLLSFVGEVWADVSLLHSAPTTDESFDPDYFDFDWLFSYRESEHTPANRISAATLNSLTEAQARIVSASPALDLSSTS